MRFATPPSLRRPASPLSDVREGLLYASSHRPARGILLLTASASLFAYPFILLMPVIAREMLHTGAGGYGGLLSATGVGALLGGVTLAAVGHRAPRGRFLVAGAFVLPATLAGLAFSALYPLSIAVLVVLGWGMVAQNVTANAILQTTTPEALRGRVMSLFTLVLMGLVPLGSLFGGALAERFGARAALGGGAAVFAVAAFALHRSLPDMRRTTAPAPEGRLAAEDPAGAP